MFHNLYFLPVDKSICSLKLSINSELVISTNHSAVSGSDTKNHFGITQLIIQSNSSPTLFL
ncbi:MAG: hypothetical protein Q8S84_07065 [bacterium]|nr:hypothetical protein [bacterium]